MEFLCKCPRRSIAQLLVSWPNLTIGLELETIAWFVGWNFALTLLDWFLRGCYTKLQAVASSQSLHCRFCSFIDPQTDNGLSFYSKDRIPNSQTLPKFRSVSLFWLKLTIPRAVICPFKIWRQRRVVLATVTNVSTWWKSLATIATSQGRPSLHGWTDTLAKSRCSTRLTLFLCKIMFPLSTNHCLSRVHPSGGLRLRDGCCWRSSHCQERETGKQACFNHPPITYYWTVPLILDHAYWETNEFENCWYKSVRILKVLKLLLQQFLNFSSFQQDMSGPILGTLSNKRWSGVSCLNSQRCVKSSGPFWRNKILALLSKNSVVAHLFLNLSHQSIS